MPILIIQSDGGEVDLLRVQIKAIDPAKATIAILEALAKIEPAKKTRADKGTKRQPTLLPKKANGAAPAHTPTGDPTL